MLRTFRGWLAGRALRLALRLNRIRPGTAIIFYGEWSATAAAEWAALAVFQSPADSAKPAGAIVPAECLPAFVSRLEYYRGKGPK